jgi:TRAP-type C4-dicarboxylate transport system substrate-binding protein
MDFGKLSGSVMSRCRAAMLVAGCILATGCGSRVDDAGDRSAVRIHVIGSAANSNIYDALEEPFWTGQLPQASNGRIAVDLRSIEESGLKAPQIARLLSAGALDVAYGDFAAIAGDVREFEGLDLAGVITDIDTLHRAADAYKPVIDQVFNQQGVKLLGLFPYPMFAFYCSGTVASLDDLKGKKIRVPVQAMADFVGELGAVSVGIPFPDVVPALQTGVADCAVTGTYSGNKARWHEVTDSLYSLPIGSGMAFYGYSTRGWRELDPTLRTLIESEFAKFELAAWELIRRQTQVGINCNTGQGECIGGTVADMKLHEPSAADIARAHEIARTVVVPNWASRCSEKCVSDWNETVGRVVGIRAERKK